MRSRCGLADWVWVRGFVVNYGAVVMMISLGFLGLIRWLTRWRYGLIALVTAAIVVLHLGIVQAGIVQAAAAPDGQFRVEYGPIGDSVYAPFRQAMQDEQLFENLAEGLNQSLKLPIDVTITLASCGAENAFYSSDEKRLVMCDELLGHFAKIFAPDAKSDEELVESILYANIFVFFHELGHALIDIFDLPTVGREEDAVDEFSTLLLLQSGEDGEKAVLSAADWFRLQSQGDTAHLAFWDQHSLDMQRFFGVACLVYGKEPDKFSGLIDNRILPTSRAAHCRAEYQKKFRSWEKLLAPYSR